MIKAAKWDVEVTQGNTLDWVLTFPFDLTGLRVRHVVCVDENTAAVLSADSDDGDIVIDETTATWQELPLALDAITYQHEIRIDSPSGAKHSWIKGKFRVKPTLIED